MVPAMRRMPRLSHPREPHCREPVFANDSMPPTIIYMIAGPHSGFTLDAILEMKSIEERELGFCYWGYAGSLCHPERVNHFVAEAVARDNRPPQVVFGKTSAKYRSKSLGRITKYSTDAVTLHPLPLAVTMIGCSVAVVCRDFRVVAGSIDLNQYCVANGSRQGLPVGQYIRYQINKACGILGAPSTRPALPRLVNVCAVAQLTAPYCVYLSP